MSKSSLLTVLLAASAAAQPSLVLVPSGFPETSRLSAADRGFTLNEEVLTRYGFTLKKYQDMPPRERDRVFDWVRVLETERLAALRSRAVPPGPSPTADPANSEALARLRRVPDAASLFDGTKSDGFTVPVVPSLTLRGPDDVRKLTLTMPDGTRLEGGKLGLGGTSPLVFPSPYVGLAKDGSGTGSAFDYDYKLRAYALGLNARLFADDAPELDARIDKGVDALGSADPRLGLRPGADALRDSLAFRTTPETTWMSYVSALGRFGRAYSLFPRVDLGWSVMGDMRVAGVFPNATLDQTAGVRVDAGGGTKVGVFGGVTEALGMFKDTVIADSLEARKKKTSIHPEAAPHAELAAWGKVPYVSGAQYTLSAGRQWNPWTTLTSASAGIEAPVGSAKVGAFGRWSSEDGTVMEFGREKTSVGLTVKPSPGVGLSAEYFRDHASLGDARIDSSGAFLSLTLSEANGPARGQSVTMESLFGGREQLVSPQDQAAFAGELDRGIALLLALKGAKLGPGGASGGWDAVRKYWGELDPGAQAALASAWASALPKAPALTTLMSVPGAGVSSLDQAVSLLADSRVLERLLVRYVRMRLLDKLDAVEVPLLGKMKLTAPVVLAAANAYALGLKPLPSVTAADQRTLDALLINELGKKASCPPGDANAVTDCVISKLPPDAAKALKSAYGDDLAATLRSAVDWPSGVLRREVNRLALQVMLAAEALDELSADGGEKIADANVRAVMTSFGRLDARRRGEARQVFKAAAASLKEELADQDARLRGDLTEYGARRLAWLQAQPAWPSNVKVAVRSEDWPTLLAVYGDGPLFGLILRAKAALAQSHPSEPARLLIEIDRNPLGAASVTKGELNVIGLPPVKRSLDDLTLGF